MNAEIILTFASTISINGSEITPVTLSHITDRIREIIESIVYPEQLTSLRLQETRLVAHVIATNTDIYNFLDNVGYYLNDQDILRLGITSPKGINSIGQDIWAEGDISLDAETLMVIGIDTNKQVDLIPILINQEIFFLV